MNGERKKELRCIEGNALDDLDATTMKLLTIASQEVIRKYMWSIKQKLRGAAVENKNVLIHLVNTKGDLKMCVMPKCCNPHSYNTPFFPLTTICRA